MIILFVYKVKKNNEFIPLFYSFTTVPRPMHSGVEPGCAAACLQREECTHTHTHTRKEDKSYYSHSFVTLRLTVTRTILTMSLLLFWALNFSVVLLSMQSQKSLWFHQKYLNLCSEDEWRSYRFETTWGWVVNDKIFIFEWTIPSVHFEK